VARPIADWMCLRVTTRRARAAVIRRVPNARDVSQEQWNTITTNFDCGILTLKVD